VTRFLSSLGDAIRGLTTAAGVAGVNPDPYLRRSKPLLALMPSSSSSLALEMFGAPTLTF